MRSRLRCRLDRLGSLGRIGAALLVSASLAGCGDGNGASVWVAPPRRAGPSIAASIDAALFTVDCTFSHRAPDDPIVYPGQSGASHMHDFFGAEGTDAASTAGSLRGGPTTCEDPEDTASYWAPAIYDGARPVDASVLRAYYRAAPGADVSEIRAVPAGMEMIVGDPHRPEGDWPSTGQVGWGCGWRPLQFHHLPPGDCTVNAPLTLRLVYPDCWDGEHLGSADHHDHVAYSTRGWCPPGHPVPIVQVQVSIQYPVWAPTPGASSPRAARLTLASGGWQGAHGDFLNAWDEERLAHQTDLCIRAMANCTIG